MENEDFDKHRELSHYLVIEGFIRERLPRLTFDFDGSVLSTKGHAKGTAVGFNFWTTTLLGTELFVTALAAFSHLAKLCIGDADSYHDKKQSD